MTTTATTTTIDGLLTADNVSLEIASLMTGIESNDCDDEIEIIPNGEHLKVTKSTTRYKTSQINETSCPNCHSNNVKLQAGSYICFNCYSLLENTFDEGGEWKTYQNDSTNGTNPRCSLQVNPYLPETSSHTFMKTNETAAGDRYSQRFHQLSSWMVPHHEKSLNSRLHDIVYFGNLCNLPGNVIEFTKQIYVEFTELQPIYKKKKSSRGDCHNAILAVILLVASKEYGIRRSPDDICDGVGITTTDFTKATNLVFSVLQHSHLLDISNHQYIVNSGDYINSFCRALDITSPKIIEQIYEIEKKVQDLKILKRHTPQASAAGIIFFVGKMRNIQIDRHDYDTKCGVSLPTLNKVYETLTQYTDKLI